MHQDEHNQAEQPEQVEGTEATDQPGELTAPEPPVTDADPAQAVDTSSSAGPVHATYADASVESPQPVPGPSQAYFAEAPFESVDSATRVESPHPESAPAGALFAEISVASVDVSPWVETLQPEPSPVEVPLADLPAATLDAASGGDVPQSDPAPAFESPSYASPSWSSSDEPNAAPPGSRLDFAQAPPDWATAKVSAETADYSQSPVLDPVGAFEGVPAPPPVWMAAPISDAPAEGVASDSRPYERPAEPHIEMPQGGPNWMLAFVCAWAAFTAFMEAPVAYAAKETMINGSSVTLTAGDRLYGGLGFALLGLGLLLFGIEALLWGRRRRGVSALLSIGFPVLVSLGGIVCLVLSHYPGSRI